MDHAATTPLSRETLAVMTPYFTDVFANPSSLHAFGRKAAEAVDEARAVVAEILGAKATEIYFTSGGTESDNFAVKGVAVANAGKGKRLLYSALEHPAVSHAVRDMVEQGFTAEKIAVDKDGFLDLADLENKLTADTTLVSVMHASNELGTVQPVREAAALSHKAGALFFADAVQTAGHLPVKVGDLGVDLLSLSAHKFYGPKGVGVLYVKSGTPVFGLVSGGHQEHGKRGGTTFVAGVVGLADALKRAESERENEEKRVKKIRDEFVKRVLSTVDGAHLNGGESPRLSSNADFRFDGINGEALLYNLDLGGVAASNGSACSAGTVAVSDALLAIGLTEDEAKSSIRFTFGKLNKEEDAERAANVLREKIAAMRE